MVHENISGIRDREEPIEASGLLLVRTYSGRKGRGVLKPPVQDGAGVTQGGLVSPTIFNIVVYAEVRATLMYVCGQQEAQHGLG